jgi:hypothetical protein
MRLIRKAIVTPGGPWREMRLRAGHLRLELGGDLAGLREAAGLLLREDDLVVDRDLEHPAGSLDELGLDAELPLDLFRQTGGARIVVSDGAVLDDHVGRHTLLLSRPHYTGAVRRLFKRGMKWRGTLVRQDNRCGWGPERDKSREKILPRAGFRL